MVSKVMTGSDQSSGSEPLYASVQDDLLDRIAQGVYPPGSTLPSEARLCREYDVSRITIRRALDGLAERRLIRRSQGAGTVVCEPEELGKSAFLTGYIDDVIPLNRHRVLADERGLPPEAIRLALRMREGVRARCIVSVNHVDERPLSFTRFWFPPDCAELISPEDFYGTVPPIRIIEQRSGRPVARAEQAVDPVLADQEAAERLSVAPGAPLLQASRTYFDTGDRPLESIVVRYHPERYRFRVTLLPKVVPVRRPPQRRRGDATAPPAKRGGRAGAAS